MRTPSLGLVKKNRLQSWKQPKSRSTRCLSSLPLFKSSLLGRANIGRLLSLIDRDGPEADRLGFSKKRTDSEGELDLISSGVLVERPADLAVDSDSEVGGVVPVLSESWDRIEREEERQEEDVRGDGREVDELNEKDWHEVERDGEGDS